MKAATLICLSLAGLAGLVGRAGLITVNPEYTGTDSRDHAVWSHDSSGFAIQKVDQSRSDFEYRGIVEYRLPELSGSITYARIRFQASPNPLFLAGVFPADWPWEGIEMDVNVNGFAGDGIHQLSDAVAGSLIFGPEHIDPFYLDARKGKLSFNLSSFVRSLYASGAEYAGFTFWSPAEDGLFALAAYEGTPVLLDIYTADHGGSDVPESSRLPLFLLAAAGLAGLHRRLRARPDVRS